MVHAGNRFNASAFACIARAVQSVSSTDTDMPQEAGRWQPTNPLELVMVGDLTDLTKFTDDMNAAYQKIDPTIFIVRKDIQHLAARRKTNGCPDPILKMGHGDIYLHSQLKQWFESYVITHRNFMHGRLQSIVPQIYEGVN